MIMSFWKPSQLAILILFSILSVVPVKAETIVNFIDPDLWGQPDEVIGLGGGLVEDFEDTALAPGLFIEISDTDGNFTGAGSSTLPNLCDPVNGDPHGDSFNTGVWDGSHVLVNTEFNEIINYGSQDWRPVAFYVPEGTSWIAIASQQVTINHFLYVNDERMDRLETLGFQLSTGPNGVMIVRSGNPNTLIHSVSFGGRGDAFTVDHVVFAPPGSLSTQAATLSSIKALFR